MGKDKEEDEYVTFKITVGSSTIIPSEIKLRRRAYGDDPMTSDVAAVRKYEAEILTVINELATTRIGQLDDVSSIIDSCIIDKDLDTGAFRDDLRTRLQECVSELAEAKTHLVNHYDAVGSFLSQFCSLFG